MALERLAASVRLLEWRYFAATGSRRALHAPLRTTLGPAHCSTVLAWYRCDVSPSTTASTVNSGECMEKSWFKCGAAAMRILLPASHIAKTVCAKQTRTRHATRVTTHMLICGSAAACLRCNNRRRACTASATSSKWEARGPPPHPSAHPGGARTFCAARAPQLLTPPFISPSTTMLFPPVSGSRGAVSDNNRRSAGG